MSAAVQQLRDAPTAEFIARLRALYPIEPEMDRMLTRKLERRAGARLVMPDLETLAGCVRAMLAETLDGPFTVSDPRWLSGGASKLQMRFTLDWQPAQGARRRADLVVRMEPAESLNASSRQREYDLLTALAGTLPVPETLWVDAEGRWFPEPALIYAFSRGVGKPSVGSGTVVTGLGTQYGARLRGLLAPQFVGLLGKLHTFAHESAALDSFSRPEPGTDQAARWQLNRTRRVWEEDSGGAFPLMDVAANWLERNLPVLDVASVVHGDYRAGNFLFDEANGEITAILDWERAYIGDRHRDLAWSSSRVVGHYDETGTFLVCGLVPEPEFHARYEAASGLPVIAETLRWYGILTRFQQIQTVLGTAYRIVRLGLTHQSVLATRLEGAAFIFAEELRRALETDQTW